MKEVWTGSLIGKMHNSDVSYKDLADQLGVSVAYITMILNCRRKPKGAREKLERAFHEVLSMRKENAHATDQAAD